MDRDILRQVKSWVDGSVIELPLKAGEVAMLTAKGGDSIRLALS